MCLDLFFPRVVCTHSVCTCRRQLTCVEVVCVLTRGGWGTSERQREELRHLCAVVCCTSPVKLMLRAVSCLSCDPPPSINQSINRHQAFSSSSGSTTPSSTSSWSESDEESGHTSAWQGKQVGRACCLWCVVVWGCLFCYFE